MYEYVHHLEFRWLRGCLPATRRNMFCMHRPRSRPLNAALPTQQVQPPSHPGKGDRPTANLVGTDPAEGSHRNADLGSHRNADLLARKQHLRQEAAANSSDAFALEINKTAGHAGVWSTHFESHATTLTGAPDSTSSSDQTSSPSSPRTSILIGVAITGTVCLASMTYLAITRRLPGMAAKPARERETVVGAESLELLLDTTMSSAAVV